MSIATPDSLVQPGADAREEPVVLDLVRDLCLSLRDARVAYCHWKSNEALDRSWAGLNDLDLLVARTDRARFLAVLARLGFKEARLPPAREVPAVAHYYGLDRATGRLVHVHAHFRLVLGDDTTKNFWLPIETAYLASRTRDDLLPVPAPEHELAVLVLRLVLKHATWDARLQRRGALSASEQRELSWLLGRTDWQRVEEVVAANLPFLVGVWPACRRAIEPGCPQLARILAADRLTRALASCARRPRGQDTALRVSRRLVWALRGRVVRRPVPKRLPGGGALVAVVGGDGAGKSTAVAGLVDWLSGSLEVQHVHLGRPPKSLTTVLLTGGLALARRSGAVPGLTTARPGSSTARLLGQGCTARDRRRSYTRARRVAARGGVVISDRFPLRELPSMDGPRSVGFREHPALGRLGRALVAYESRQYGVFTRPDVLAVLRVDPEVAVRRKSDEDSAYVRRRSTEVWNATWDRDVVVIDAARPAAEVLADLRAAVWERL